MNLRQLRYFVEVARVGSFVGAAKKLHMAQPSLWRTVKTFESELGFALFESSGRGVRPTKAGSMLLDRAEQLLERAEALEHYARDLREGREGLIILGCPAPQIDTILAPVIGRFRKNHPGIFVSVRQTDAIPDLSSLLGDEGFDFVTSPSRVDDDLERHFLTEANVIVVTAEDHEFHDRDQVEVQDLAGLPMILPATSNHTLSRQLLAPVLDKYGMTLNVVFEPSTLATAVATAKAGVGIAVVGAHLADSVAPKGPLLVDEGVPVSTAIWLYWRSDVLQRNQSVQPFLDIIQSRATRLPA